MTRFLTILLMGVCLIAVCGAQTPTNAPMDSGYIGAAEPQFAISAGLGWNHFDTPQIKGWGTFAARVADKTYSLSTLDMTSKAASVRTGILRNVFVGGGWTIGVLADFGVVAGESSVAGAFTGGGAVTRDLSKVTKIPGAFAVGAVRVVQLGGGAGVSPTFSFGFGKAF